MLENEKVQCENLMEFIVELAPVLQKLVPLDCMIRVTDTQKYIGYVPGEKINDNAAIGYQQAAATEELSSTMEELAVSADTLKQATISVIG